MTTWRKQLEAAMKAEKDTSPIIAVAPGESILDIKFDGGYGGSCGQEVLVWTQQRVYFPVVYDGAEWLGSAPRDPQPEGQAHVRGE
jgi:hypothetical protein